MGIEVVDAKKLLEESPADQAPDPLQDAEVAAEEQACSPAAAAAADAPRLGPPSREGGAGPSSMVRLRQSLRTALASPKARKTSPTASASEVGLVRSEYDSRLLAIETQEEGHGALSVAREKGQTGLERAVETFAALGTAYAHITKALEYRGRPIYAIVSFLLFWIIWVAWQYRKHGRWVMRSWGFSCSWLHLRHSFVLPTLLFAMWLPLLAAVCRTLGKPLVVDNWHMWLAVALYPPYGLLQHFLLQSLYTRNLSYLITGSDKRTLWTDATERPSARTWSLLALCVLSSSLLFSLLHWPHRWLMIGTGALGIPWTVFFLRDRCLWPLGFYHGVMGCFFYYWFLQSDPLARAFSRVNIR